MNISSWISRRADWSPDKTAVRFEGRAITYPELDAEIRRLAAMLDGELGVKSGDRVAHLGLNGPDLLALLFACARIGAILVPLNWRLAPPEHLYILRNCAPNALLVEPEFIAATNGIRDGLGGTQCVAYGPPQADWLSYDTLLQAAADDASNARAGLESAVMLVYTSGTTGRPKGAVLTQNALFWNAINAISAQDITSADHVLTVLPMFHVGGMNIQTTPVLHAGGTVTIHRRFDPGATLAAINDDRPTLFLSVPALIQALITHPDWVTSDLSSLRLVGTGSSTVPEALIRAWLDRGIPVAQVYGLTESGPVAICLPEEDAVARIGSCGKPAMHCDARIADDAGNDVPTGETGEILLRGPNLLSHYWNDPAATEAAFSGDWFHTGDVGHRDADGYYYVDDRKKDVVISGGENIYPAELENVLADCPDIAEFAVVGRMHEKWGEVAVACIVPRDGSALTPDDVTALFQDRLARYKHPRDVVFMTELPRNVMGKVLKYELRRQLATEAG